LVPRHLAGDHVVWSGGPDSGAEVKLRRAVEAMRERPVLAFAVLAMACAHAAMVGIMIMTPLHMEHGHAELEVIGLVISIHVLGMFAFAPLVGMLADRAGRPTTMLLGACLLLVAAVLCAWSPEGSSWRIVGGLFLLGLGWSFVTVAASTLVAQHAPLDVRTDVQGTSDLLMSLTAAGAGGAAGLIVDAWGYPELSVVSVGLVALIAVAGFGARATTRLAG
jgi:MFS family permease